MNISITSASGNIGKSTICLNLSLMLNENFENIKIFDCDERMETLKEVMNLRAKNNLEHIKVFSKNEDIEESLTDKKSLNLYDLKGHLGAKEATIINNSNLVVVLTSNEDLVLKKTLKFVNDLKQNEVNYIVLINKFNDKLVPFSKIEKMFKGKLFNSYLKDKISYKKIEENGELFYDKKNKLVGLRTTKIEFDNFCNEFIDLISSL